MKNFIKTLVAASILLAGASVQAAEAPTTFTQFSQLPRDMQTQIILAINEGATPLDAAIRLKQLRLVSHQIKNIIESPYSGKDLMQKIAARFPKDKLDLLDAAFALNTPGSIAWIKEEVNSGTISKDTFNLFLESLINVQHRPKVTVQSFLQLIDDPNYIVDPERGMTLLATAVQYFKYETINGLIDGLIKAGADINFITIPTITGERQTILDDTHFDEAIKFLRSKGAKTLAELERGQ